MYRLSHDIAEISQYTVIHTVSLHSWQYNGDNKMFITVLGTEVWVKPQTLQQPATFCIFLTHFMCENVCPTATLDTECPKQSVLNLTTTHNLESPHPEINNVTETWPSSRLLHSILNLSGQQDPKCPQNAGMSPAQVPVPNGGPHATTFTGAHRRTHGGAGHGGVLRGALLHRAKFCLHAAVLHTRTLVRNPVNMTADRQWTQHTHVGHKKAINGLRLHTHTDAETLQTPA